MDRGRRRLSSLLAAVSVLILLAVPLGPTGATDIAVSLGAAYRSSSLAQPAVTPDVTLPSVPTHLSGESTGDALVLAWAPADDNVAVAGYLVHRDGQFLAWVSTGTRFRDSEVVAGRTYLYEVRAQDTSGNNSAPTRALAMSVERGPADPPLGGLSGLIVSSSGNDAAADGSAARPYRTVNAAARAAPTGATLYLGNGVFREAIDLDGKSLHIRAVPGAEPVLSGADIEAGWTASGGRWFAPGSDFPDRGWPSGLTASARSGLVGIVVYNGAQLRQVTTEGEVGSDTFWVDGANRVWIGRNPAGATVEIARRGRGIFAHNVDGFEVDGVQLRHFASGPGDQGALEIWGTRAVVRNVYTHDNANAGLRIVGASPLVDGSRLDRNGRIGASLYQADGAAVRGNVLSFNNTEGFDVFGAAGGVKVTASRNITLAGNTVADNLGHGIWVDLSSVGIAVSANQALRNTEAGIHVEVSARATITDNVTLANGRGIYVVESNDVQITGNVTGFNDRNILVLDGYRDGNGCVDREVGATHPPPIDDRFGCQWPTVKWDIDHVSISGNTIVGGSPRSASFAMVEVNHVADPARDVGGKDRRKSAEALHVTVGANAFERRQAGIPRWIVGWSQWPSPMAAYESVAAFTAATGQGAGSTYVGP